MKKYINYQLIGLFIIFMAILSGCEISDDHEGNGNVVSERRNITDFNEIEVDGVFDIILKQDDFYRVEVVTDENLQKIVETEKSNGVLKITTKDDNDYDATQMDVYITMPDITRILLEGVNSLRTEQTMVLDNIEIIKNNTGDLSFDALVNQLNIISHGIGDIELLGKGTDVTLTNDMVGDISAFGFKAYNLNLKHDGTGKIEVYVTNNFQVEISGVGDVYCKGNPGNITYTGENIVGHLYIVD